MQVLFINLTMIIIINIFPGQVPISNLSGTRHYKIPNLMESKQSHISPLINAINIRFRTMQVLVLNLNDIWLHLHSARRWVYGGLIQLVAKGIIQG